MRHILQSSLRQLLADRTALILSGLILLGGAAFIVFVSLNLTPSDLQLATRYTSYGQTHFYRNKWFYLFSFIGFGVLYLVVHVGIITKLIVSQMKQLAHAFAWLSLIVLVLMFVYTYSVLQIAYLS
jgi:hypothetical protein